MLFRLTLAGGLTLGLAALAVAQNGSEPTTTSSGWFSDKGCAEPRVKRGQIGPNNPDCVKRCLDEGAVPVFISEQAKALFVTSATASRSRASWTTRRRRSPSRT
jgi:hypothetical protein